MPLETASTIADLVSTNPVGASDTPAALDDHIQLIKKVLKADALVNADIGVNVAAVGAVTSSGLTQSTAKLLGRTTAGTGAVEEISVSGATLSAGTLTIASTTFSSSAENIAGTVENKAVDPLGIREAFNASGSAPVYACRAWCTFDGTVAGTNAPTAGGNVTSVTRNGTGDYTINFSTALEDANYSVSLSSQYDTSSGDTVSTSLAIKNTVSPTTSELRIVSVGNVSATMYDSKRISVMVFR